jgi:hypothetical protein
LLDDADARPGDRIAAAREILDRAVGRPASAAESEILQRIEALEAAQNERQAVNGN